MFARSCAAARLTREIAQAIRDSVASKWEGHEINTARFIQPERSDALDRRVMLASVDSVGARSSSRVDRQVAEILQPW